MPLIVIDGVDLTGKTRLAKRLSQQFSPPAAVLWHAGPPTTGSSWREYALTCSGYRPGRDALVVDRSFPSEHVWPTVFGRTSDLDEAGFDAIARYLDELGCVHVHAARRHDYLMEDLLKNPDEPLRPAQLELAAALYDDAYARIAALGFLVLPWDFDVMGEEDVQRIADEARLAELRAVKRRELL